LPKTKRTFERNKEALVSNRVNCKGLETDMLWDLADHAQAEIDRWNSVLNRVLAQLAMRGEIEE
jgi:hypothetical protein